MLINSAFEPLSSASYVKSLAALAGVFVYYARAHRHWSFIFEREKTADGKRIFK